MSRRLDQKQSAGAAGIALLACGWLLPRVARGLRELPGTNALAPRAGARRAALPGSVDSHGNREGRFARSDTAAHRLWSTESEFDAEQPLGQNHLARAAGLLLVICIAWFLPWLFAHADLSEAWIAIPFVLATMIVAAGSLLAVVNRWQRAIPGRVAVPAGREPTVAVLIPTLGEPPVLLENTLRSVLDQDWPSNRLWIVVSDDAGDPSVRDMVNEVALAYPQASVRYHRPPGRDDPTRQGEAKAGNLNSALMLVPSEIRFIESRDADDLVGDEHFLRETVGQLLADVQLGFVQTDKAGKVSPHDPFDNRQPHFFRSAMFSRHAANAVFPCGSGVVWRRAALHDIGDFPTWNLVEDLQSGLEALRRAWDGCYLPILGAYAQHSPEDLPNFVKQRGTWALDTVRLSLWASKRGLTLRQRLQFYELGLFYLQGPATLVFLLVPIIGFALHVYPVATTTSAFIVHFWPFAIALELHLVLINRRLSLEELWRARLTWAGLSFVYARACVLAVVGGRTRKPRYVVTRKENQHAWHWRQVFPHMVLLALLLGSMAWSLAGGGLVNTFDVGSAYWAVLYSLLMIGFIRLSWHGVPPVMSRNVRDRISPHQTSPGVRTTPARRITPAPAVLAAAPAEVAAQAPMSVAHSSRNGLLPRYPLRATGRASGAEDADVPPPRRLSGAQPSSEAPATDSRALVKR
jgi:cellulose synthase (UDP-forming)